MASQIRSYVSHQIAMNGLCLGSAVDSFFGFLARGFGEAGADKSSGSPVNTGLCELGSLLSGTRFTGFGTRFTGCSVKSCERGSLVSASQW